MSHPTFFSFRKPSDWRRGTSFHLEQSKRGFTIRRESVYRLLRAHHLAHPQLVAAVADTAVNRDGRWFLLDEKGVVWKADMTSNHVEAIRQSGAADINGKARIAASRDSLFMLQTGPSSVLHSLTDDRGQVRWTVSEWYGEAMVGLAIAADREDGILVLAAVGSPENMQLIRFDSAGIPSLQIAMPWIGEIQPDAIELDRFQLTVGTGNKGWLLDKETQQLIHINLDTNTVQEVPVVFAPESESIVAVADGGSDSVWALTRTHQGITQYSLARIGLNGEIAERGNVGSGQGDRLFSETNRILIWDSKERNVYTIQPVSETSIWKPIGRRIGIWISDALDSGVPETEWHKIVLDAEQENDTQLIVRYYASDQPEAVIDHEKVHLDAYIRDPGISPETKFSALAKLWSEPLKDPEDALLLHAKGRYLWISMELIGSERHAPHVRSLEVHFPRASLLEYLPSIYQRYEPSKDFLSRFLSVFQTMLDETDRNISKIPRTFDANGVSGDSLRWILGWLGIHADDQWSEEQLRTLLRKAPLLYRLRGTKYAIEQMIEIYTGEKPIILEYDQVKPLKENSELGEVAERLYAPDPHSFNVLVKADHADTETKRATLQQIVESLKPVFASFKLVVLQPWVYMDLHSYLGMNTVLSEPTLLALDGRSSMPHHTIIIDLGLDNRLDQHTRLGLDSRLE